MDATSVCQRSQISIHAPHARSDALMAYNGLRVGISIHAPHARSDDIIRHNARIQ